MLIEFTIPGAPQGKARPRMRVVTTKGGKSFATQYSPKETVSYENLVKTAFRQVHQGPPTEQPIRMSIHAHFPIPVSWSNKKRAAAVVFGNPCTAKPDWDNIGKVVSDALNEIAWKDDKQVFACTVTKTHSDTPRVEVRIQYPNEEAN